MLTTLKDLRRFTVARNFFPPTTLKRAIDRMGFVQADPIRAPARAQDLILRHRVKNYRAGDLERRYASLDVDEDVFVNYGFVSSRLRALMHPRLKSGITVPRLTNRRKREQLLLEFVRERGPVHPREVDEHFSHGLVTNYWGGSSNATTHLLEDMHYRGLLRVARREKGIRVYMVSEVELAADAGRNARAPSSSPIDALNALERDARIDALVDAVVNIYAPLPSASLSFYIRRLRYAAPQWREWLTGALRRAKEGLPHARVDGLDWYWGKEGEMNTEQQESVRFLAPFDPLVHDRARFKLLWNWEYRFEAYTPIPKRKLGYYALPLLWRDQMIGWANLSVNKGDLVSEFGYAGSAPRDRTFKRELEVELDRMRVFLGLDYWQNRSKSRS